MKVVFEQDINRRDVDVENAGCARIVEISNGDPESPLFFRMHSWDNNGEHTQFNSWIGKRVRLTLEVIE